MYPLKKNLALLHPAPMQVANLCAAALLLP